MNTISLALKNIYSAQHKQGDLMSRCSQDDLLSQHGGGFALSQRSQGDLSSVSHSFMMSCSPCKNVFNPSLVISVASYKYPVRKRNL